MKDPAVEEVRVRRKMLLQDRYQGSIAKMLEATQQWQKEHPRQALNLRGRKHGRSAA